MRKACCLSLLFTLAAACASNTAFRGKDHGAFLPVVRARLALRDETAVAATQRVRFLPAIEGGASYIHGGFPQGSVRPSYTAQVAHVAFAPELAWRALRVGPLAGFAYGDIAVESSASRIHSEGVGLLVGAQAAWSVSSWFVPYARLVGAHGIDWAAPRWELGMELRANAQVGLQLAYAHQTSRLRDDVFTSSSSRVETDGLQLGLMLRF